MTYPKSPKTDDLIYIFSFPKEFRNVSYEELDNCFKSKIMNEIVFCF